MNIVDNESSPTSHQFDPQETIPPSEGGEWHSSEHTGAPDLRDVSSSARRELAPRLALDTQEAKIRGLQKAIEDGIYRVAAEQIADKMLRDTLRDQLP